MYYFLGLTLTEDILNGSFWPSYVLCRARTTSTARTGLRVVKQLDGNPTSSLPKVLVTETTGHEDLLNFLSVYQTQDGFKGVHYHPEGMLCWYSCNRYGEPIGGIVLDRKVPIKNLMWSFSRKRKYRLNSFSQKKTLKDAFYLEKKVEEYKTIKPRLFQPADKKTMKGKKNNGKH